MFKGIKSNNHDVMSITLQQQSNVITKGIYVIDLIKYVMLIK